MNHLIYSSAHRQGWRKNIYKKRLVLTRSLWKFVKKISESLLQTINQCKMIEVFMTLSFNNIYTVFDPKSN